MKSIIAIVALMVLSGCSTYSTHLKTGCVWSCAEWEKRLAQGDNTVTVSGMGSSSGGISAHTYNLPNASYMVIRSGSTTSVIQTSKSR
jgi:uncharacterized lipoprotein YmbA